MPSHRSISERLHRAGTIAVQREIAHDWATSWQSDHADTLTQLERAIGRGDIARAGQIVGQIKALDAKRFGALPGVIDALTDDDML